MRDSDDVPVFFRHFCSVNEFSFGFLVYCVAPCRVARAAKWNLSKNAFPLVRRRFCNVDVCICYL
jgi:hypothetical protein